MHQACEIIAKLVDDDKINGQDAVILMHAVLNNNLKTNDWFISTHPSWWQPNISSISTTLSNELLNNGSILTTTNP